VDTALAHSFSQASTRPHFVKTYLPPSTSVSPLPYSTLLRCSGGMYLHPEALADLPPGRNGSIELTLISNSALRNASAFRASRSAFRPAVSTGLRASAARFASDSAIHGKIHQVIGAIVDGECPENSSSTTTSSSASSEIWSRSSRLHGLAMLTLFYSKIRYRQAPSHS
jgi:hypothetical protein